VNIALVNDLKVQYDKIGIDVWDVIEAAKTKPSAFQRLSRSRPRRALYPDRPFYLTWLTSKHVINRLGAPRGGR
jgi:UDP-N-acetyl-D-glucosamine dehydrogenase